jgi:hypothetical protein
MKVKMSILMLFFSIAVIGQQTKEWINMLENPKYDIYDLVQKNQRDDFAKYDFSTLLVPRQEFLGYIGSDYCRLKIFFTSVTKDSTDPLIYRIKGISVVKNNKCDFAGNIIVKQIRKYKSMHFGVDDEYKNRGLVSQGIFIGEYKFEEDVQQNHSGIFQGIMTLNWYLDKFGIIHYDNIQWYSDNYKNNQYIGTWIQYSSTINKVCNWGEYRIPFSGDLDIGAGEFSPNPKYFNEGWEDLKIE